VSKATDLMTAINKDLGKGTLRPASDPQGHCCIKPSRERGTANSSLQLCQARPSGAMGSYFMAKRVHLVPDAADGRKISCVAVP